MLSLLVKSLFFAPRYTIEEFRYDPESVAMYDDPELYSLINDELVGRNYFMYTWFSKNVVRERLQESYPLLRAIDVKLQDDSVWFISIEFYNPALIFQLPWDRFYLSYNESLYPLTQEDGIIEMAQSMIQLPLYTETLSSIDWIFHRISEQELTNIIQEIQTTLWRENLSEIIYLPWWEKIFLGYESKRIYLHADKDITRQLSKLLALKQEETQFNDYEIVRVIDLWSSDDIIVQY